MNDKRPTPDKSAGRHKRTAPTIDLEAKEIPSATPAAEPVVQATDAELQPTPAPEVAKPAEAAKPADAPKPSEPSKPEPAKEATAAKSALGGAPSIKSAPSSKSEAPAGGAAPAPKGAGMPWGAMIGSGVAGAALMAAVVIVGWSAGLFAPNETTTSDPRVAALEAQIKALQSRPAAASTDTAALDALTPRIAKLEQQLAKLASSPATSDAVLNDRIAANDNAMKSLGVALTALNRRYDEVAAAAQAAQARADAAEKTASELRGNLQDVSKTAAAGASSADLASLQQRLSALEQQATKAQAELAKATQSDQAARLALSAAALRDAVTRGAPYVAELTQARALGADDKTLAPLSAFAASGVPSAQTMTTELSELLPRLQKAVGTPAATGGFLERLQANAEHLVRIRPAGAPAGDDAAAVLARLDVEAAQNDIAAALADIGKLPDAARQTAADWVTRAVARQKALIAARDLAADSARSLGSR